ncbi:beta-defensin 23 [Rattus norvegicus]|uniref:Beta-defensin n=2 Tax=Rattus norvegicus TaxID=10116 RepID=A6KHN6_RAT|nr:beta-defensin 129 precursor [Rattus norvegicus]AAT51893.1 beta-defensin 23 [Rattus norvegicus]EDL86069.1 beta-defensin 23 [Rattus norvegicus]|eukprot:NP_001032607.1 beta-defensin 129 precursor [Rattus norvegicus]
MKLLFPLFASLVLQYQVESEFMVVKKCLMGFGKCKDSCLPEETQVQNCKSKKCCMGPKVTELIKSYLRHEIPHIPDDDIVEMMKMSENLTEEMQRQQALVAFSQSQVAKSLLSNINSAIIPNAFPVTKRTRRHYMGNTASTERHTKQSRDSANAAPLQPRPGPP